MSEKSVNVRARTAAQIATPVPDYVDRFARAASDAKVGDTISVEGRPHRIVEVHPDHVVVVPE